MKGGMQRRLREDRADEEVWTLLAGTNGGQVSAFTCQGCLCQGGGKMSKEKKDLGDLVGRKLQQFNALKL